MIDGRPNYKEHALKIREAAETICSKCGRRHLHDGAPPYADCTGDCNALKLLQIAEEIGPERGANDRGLAQEQPCRLRKVAS